MARPDGNNDRADLVYGLHAVREALVSGSRSVRQLMVLGTDRQFRELVRAAGHHSVPVRVVPRSVLDRLARGVPHQGAVALTAPKAYVGSEDIFEYACQQGEPPFVAILDGV